MSTDSIRLDSIDAAISAMAAGQAVVVVDDADRENEGDIIFAAEFATPELMGWTIRHSSGVVCTPMNGDRADAMGLPPMVENNQDAKGTAYTVSCDAAHGVSTGISAADRALTSRILADPASGPELITRPGTSSRCARWTAGCWCAAGTPRPASTCARPRAWSPWASSPKSSTTTDR